MIDGAGREKRTCVAHTCALVLLVALAAQACTSQDQPLSFRLERDEADLPAQLPVANINVTVDASMRDARLVEAAGAAAKQVGEQLNSGKLTAAGPVRTVHLIIRAPGLVAKGKGVGAKIMHLTFAAKALQQTVHFGADNDAILASADEAGWWTPTNDDVVNAYCDQRAGSEFCRKFEDQ
jgi:hypothetical protein